MTIDAPVESPVSLTHSLEILPENAAINEIFVYRKFISETGLRDVEEYLDLIEIEDELTDNQIYSQLSESQYYINLSPKIKDQTTSINQNFTINQFIQKYEP